MRNDGRDPGRELHRHEQRKLVRRGDAVDAAAVRADHLIDRMRSNFDDALVTGWEPLEGSFGLPDPNDEHVVAAAVVGGAGAIVTENFRDIRQDLVPSHIQVLSVREFAANTADVDPSRAARALQAIAARHDRPPHTPEELLAILVERYGLADVGEILAPLVDQ